MAGSLELWDAAIDKALNPKPGSKHGKVRAQALNRKVIKFPGKNLELRYAPPKP